MQDKELKRRWVEALRSGKYQQATDGLLRVKGKEQDGYCCLGVLCDVIDPNAWDYSFRSQEWRWNQTNEMPPTHHLNELAFTIGPLKFAIMNDNDGCSFEEIAKFIEENE